MDGNYKSNILILLSRKRHCYGNQLMLGTVAFKTNCNIAKYLNARINSGDDAATGKSCSNLVNFCLVTAEMAVLICIPTYLH